ncbi:MAG: hypothetical protein ACRCZJ_04390 [Erysipelotrichaceae bacterium]
MYKIEQKKYLENAYKKFGVTLDANASVETYYSSLTLEHLKDLCRIYGIKGYSKCKKAELAKLVQQHVFSETSLKELYLTTPANDFKAVIELAKKGKLHMKAMEMNLALRLINLGMVFLIAEEGQYYLVLPQDVRTSVAKVAYSKYFKQAKQTQQVLDIMLAAIHLYGVVSLEEMAEIYAHYYAPLSANTWAEIIALADRKLVDIGVSKTHLYSLSIHDTQAEYYESNRKYDFYLPKLVTFLQYRDESFYEVDSNITSVKKFFQLNFIMPATVLEDLVSDLIYYLVHDGAFSEIATLMSYYGLKFRDEEHVKLVAGRLNVFQNQLRYRKFRGNKASETN